MSTYVFGDIQGCYGELAALLEQINPDPIADELWFAGDLINRGPNNVDTLTLLMDLPNATCVLGNHDLHFLAVTEGFKSPHRGDTIDDILHHPQRDAFTDFLMGQPLLHKNDALRAVMVHAGLPAMWSLEDALHWADVIHQHLQDPELRASFFDAMYGNEPSNWQTDMNFPDRLRLATNCLTRMRYYSHPGQLEFAHKALTSPAGFSPWFERRHPTLKDWTICFGHWATLEGVFEPTLYGLDTGCVWGRALTAVRLEDGHVFSQVALAN